MRQLAILVTVGCELYPLATVMNFPSTDNTLIKRLTDRNCVFGKEFDTYVIKLNLFVFEKLLTVKIGRD